MKRGIRALLAMMMCMCFVVPAHAAEIDLETGINSNVRAVELQNEMKSAEELLGGACKIESQEIQRVGDYVVESRLYVLDDSSGASVQSVSGISECGGVSSHTWRRYGASEWDTKVLFAAYFAYNGTTAMCDTTNYKLWAIRPDNSVISTNFNPKPSFKDGSTAKATCQYARDESSANADTVIWGTLTVTCTKTGSVGIESEVEHRYL